MNQPQKKTYPEKSNYEEKRKKFPQFKKTYDLLEKLSKKNRSTILSSDYGAVTIVSENYLALALTLAESFLKYHRESTFWIAICDHASEETINAIIKKGGAELYF